MARRYWLVKQEPSVYPWAQFADEGKTAWTGVRNFQARNNLRSMQVGDRVLYYHTGTAKAVVGVAEVVRAAYPDPTATEGDWSAVDLKAVRPLARAVELVTIRADPRLRELPLLRHTRLSAMPVSPDEFDRLVELGDEQAPSRKPA